MQVWKSSMLSKTRARPRCWMRCRDAAAGLDDGAGQNDVLVNVAGTEFRKFCGTPAAQAAFVTSAGWRVNQIASSRFGTQQSQEIAAYAVSKEKSTIPTAASPP
jgi:hypothetical protein